MDLSFNTVYINRTNLLNIHKEKIELTFHEENITGSALKNTDKSGYTQNYISFGYNDIIEYDICQFNKTNALRIDVCIKSITREWIESYIFPFEPKYKIEDVIKKLEEHITKYNNAQEKLIAKEQTRIRLQKEQEEKQQQYIKSLHNFYDAVYSFHVNDQTPVFVFNQQETNCFIAYIGENKDLNFLLIEAKTQTEIHTIIKYNEIHYYEKAGDVYYATNINANYKGGQSFGGSFVGAKVSTGAVALGGLLLGQMGMAIGALSSYKPATYTPPTYTPSQLNISSEITKIDERSVILNYYSEQHKQYIDIELPQDIYNFLQTYLPEKKYAIVIEKEKQKAISNINQPTTKEDTTIERLQKLKQLYEMELISETEYTERKKEILAEI